MKKTILAGIMLTGAFMFAMPKTSQAHDGDWDKNHHYYVDKDGYWDDHDVHQKFIMWHHHRGYWDEKGKKRIFIRVGD